MDATEIDGVPVLVIARADGSMTVLDLMSHTVLHTVEDHVGPISALAVATVNGRPHVFSAGDDAIIRSYDLRTGQRVAELAGHTDFINALAALGEGMIASGRTTLRAPPLGEDRHDRAYGPP